MIARMEMAREMGAKILEVRSDSQVVIGHIKGEYEARGEKIKWYLPKVQQLKEAFEQTVTTKIPWEDNTRADALARLGSEIEEENILYKRGCTLPLLKCISGREMEYVL